MEKLNKLRYGGSETRTVADDGRIVMSFVMRGLQRSPKGHHRFPGTAGATSQRLVGLGRRRRDVLACATGTEYRVARQPRRS